MKEWLLDNNIRIFRVISGCSNVYLIQSNSASILIDTGKKSSRGVLVSRLKKLGITKLNWLILTHTHYDHCQNAAFLKQEFGAAIIVSKQAEQNIINGNTPLPKATNRFSNMMLNLGKKLNQKRFFFESFIVNEFISEETQLNSKGIKLEIVPTPGHSSDSISVVVNNEIALVGDTLFGIFRKSVFPPFANEPKQLFAQWEKLLDTRCTTFLPGHGRPITRKLLKTCLLKTPNEG